MSTENEVNGISRPAQFATIARSPPSEYELHRHLHDSRIGCRQNAAEVRIRERRARIARIYMVRSVERLGTEFNGLLFADFKYANHAEINSGVQWPVARSLSAHG